MKTMKQLFFTMVALLSANMGYAQIEDSADEIHYFVKCEESDIMIEGALPKVHDNTEVLIFNFDGEKACLLNYVPEKGVDLLKKVKQNMRTNPDYYEDLVETNDYDVEYEGAELFTDIYIYDWQQITHETISGNGLEIKNFYSDKYYVQDYDSGPMSIKLVRDWVFFCPAYPLFPDAGKHFVTETYFMEVPKSFFRSGRSKTPQKKMIE